MDCPVGRVRRDERWRQDERDGCLVRGWCAFAQCYLVACCQSAALVAPKTHRRRLGAQVPRDLRKPPTNREVGAHPRPLGGSNNEPAPSWDDDALPHVRLLAVDGDCARGARDGNDSVGVEEEPAAGQRELKAFGAGFVCYEDVRKTEGERVHGTAARHAETDASPGVVLYCRLQSTVLHRERPRLINEDGTPRACTRHVPRSERKRV